MKPESFLVINCIGSGSETLLVDFARVGVQFQRQRPPTGAILNSAKAIKVARRFLPKALATMGTWLTARPSRRIQISFKNGQIAMFDAHNYSTDEVLKVLSEVRTVNAIETKKPEASEVKKSESTELFAVEVCPDDAAASGQNSAPHS